MPIPQEGHIIQNGGAVRITFPHFNIDMSCDNETELASCIEMMKKGLEIFETEKAKRLLMEGIEEEAREKKIAEMLTNQPIVMPVLDSNVYTSQITCKNP